MGNRVTKENIRVTIDPPSPFVWRKSVTEDDWISVCKDIVKDVRRHVDGLYEYGDRGVCVDWDTVLVCEYCGYAWGERADSPHNGGCCKLDYADMEAEEEKVT